MVLPVPSTRIGFPSALVRSSDRDAPGSNGGVDVLQSILSPSGEDYAFFDFTAANGGRLFQENIGPTPSSAIGNVIGLAVGRDKAKNKALTAVLSGQSELVTNGDFSAGGTGWTDASTAPASCSFTGGMATLTSDGTNRARARTSIATTVGRAYRLVIDVSGFVDVNAGLTVGGVENLSVGSATGSVTRYFVATAATTHIQVHRVTAGSATIDNVSIREVPAHYASQATASLKPQFQAAGAKFDGSDDNLLSDWFAQAGENCIIAQIDVPSGLVSNQTVAGQDSSSGRFSLFVNGTGGAITARLPNAGALGVGGDIRGTSAIVAVTTASLTATMFCNNVVPVSQAFTGSIATNLAFRLGGLNATGGTAANFFGGAIKRIALGKKAFTSVQFQQIRAKWLAS